MSCRLALDDKVIEAIDFNPVERQDDLYRFVFKDFSPAEWPTLAEDDAKLAHDTFKQILCCGFSPDVIGSHIMTLVRSKCEEVENVIRDFSQMKCRAWLQTIYAMSTSNQVTYQQFRTSYLNHRAAFTGVTDHSRLVTLVHLPPQFRDYMIRAVADDPSRHVYEVMKDIFVNDMCDPWVMPFALSRHPHSHFMAFAPRVRDAIFAKRRKVAVALLMLAPSLKAVKRKPLFEAHCIRLLLIYANILRNPKAKRKASELEE